MSLSQALSAAIRAEIARQRRTHQDIAEQLGVSVEVLRRRLACRREWSVDLLGEVAFALGKPMSYFIAQAEDQSVVRFPVDPHRDDTPMVIPDEEIAA